MFEIKDDRATVVKELREIEPGQCFEKSGADAGAGFYRVMAQATAMPEPAPGKVWVYDFRRSIAEPWNMSERVTLIRVVAEVQ